ncbi:transporter substrate-binding domain-containing protein, partial [Treponema sp. R6D11]
VDLVITDSIAAKYYAGKENSGLEIAWADSDLYDELIAFCLKKDNDKLTDMINGALDELNEDGTIAAIIERYF